MLFSSIALDLSCPPALADEPAISFGGVAIGTYKDYQEEADLIFRAVCEVSDEKDFVGSYHRFPNILFNIREGDLDEYEGNCKLMHELGANNPTWYYNNCIDMERSTMGCRSSLPMNYSGDYEKDCMNTGNMMYDTIGSNVITTSLSMGLIMIVSDVGSIRDYCKDDFSFFCKTKEDFVSNLHYCSATNREEIELLKKKSKQMANNLSFNKFYEQISNLE